MKFVCLNCEKYMAFQKVEAPEEGRLGITFRCETCGARFSMVTNPGETQLVSSLGVSLGGRTAPIAPLEMTRATLQAEAAPVAHATAHAGGPKAAAAAAPVTAVAAGGVAAAPSTSMAGCPFSATLRDMGIGGATSATPAAEDAAPIEVRWTDAAREVLARLPGSVRFVVTRSVEEYAQKQGYPTITPDVITAQKRGATGVIWSSDATSRLENIPDFVRPMARREIERLARERGATTVTAEVMDQAKDLFGRIGYAG